jgi:hypothetical protein
VTIREGKWKCPGCGEVNRGAVTQCAQCGATRDENTKFFLDEDAPEVTDQEELRKAEAGADWVCEYCGNASSALSPTCTGCGAPRSQKEKKHGDVIPLGAPAAGPAAPGPAPAGPGAAGPLLGLGMGAVGIFLLLSCLLCSVTSWLLFHTKSDTATVTQVSWERTVAVEDLRPTRREAWDGAPQGAYDVSHRREQRGTRRVQTGTHTEYASEQVRTGTRHVVVGHRDLGNGHFEDVTRDEPIYTTRQVPRQVATYVDEPVFGEKYFFTLDEWQVVRTERKKGGTDGPAWPPVALDGKEREGARSELYLVTLRGTSAGERTLRAGDQEVWSRLQPGSTWRVDYSAAGRFDVLDAGGNRLALAPAGAEDVIR